MARITRTIHVRRRIPGGVPDRYGTPVPAWAPPEAVPVYAVAPRAASDNTAEPHISGRPDLLIVGLTVYAPRDTRIGAGDRMEIDGEEWEVSGLPAVWEKSPVGGFMFLGGVSVNLEKVTG